MLELIYPKILISFMKKFYIKRKKLNDIYTQLS